VVGSRDGLGVCGAKASIAEEAEEAAQFLIVSSIRRLISLEYTWRISMLSSSAEAEAAAAPNASSSMRAMENRGRAHRREGKKKWKREKEIRQKKKSLNRVGKK
jgi:hypothetical protein